MSRLDEWPVGEIETMRRLWLEEKPASAIARTIGRTRSAVLGKIRRLRERGLLPAQRCSPTTPWTFARTQDLVRLWRASHATDAIGKALGLSASAVKGKAERLGLKRPKRARAAPAPRAATMAAARKEAKGKTGRAVPLLDLDRHACRWPVSADDAPAHGHLFCGDPATGNQTYCDAHAMLAAAVSPGRQERIGEALAA